MLPKVQNRLFSFSAKNIKRVLPIKDASLKEFDPVLYNLIE